MIHPTIKILFIYPPQIDPNPWLFLCPNMRSNDPTSVATIQACKAASNTVTACQAIRLDIPDPFLATTTKVTLPGFGDTNFTLLVSKDVVPEPDSKTFLSDDGGQAIFTLLTRQRQAGKRQGSGEVNLLVPVGDVHVLKKMDAIKLRRIIASNPNDSLRQEKGQTKKRMSDTVLKKLLRQGTTETSIVNFTITFYLTKELAEERNKNIVFMQIKSMIGDINQGYLNSKIPMILKLRCIKNSTISEVAFGNSSTRMLEELSSVHSTKDGADVATLMTRYDLEGESGVVCGLGYRDSIQTKNTFSVHNRECGIVAQTLTHEIGHHFGARHDIGSNPQGNPQYPYGVGYEAGTGADKGTVYTLMAFLNETRTDAGLPNVAVNYWSSPALKYSGLHASSLGNITLGEEETADNVRLLTERR